MSNEQETQDFIVQSELGPGQSKGSLDEVTHRAVINGKRANLVRLSFCCV